MGDVLTLFPTRVWRARLDDRPGGAALLHELAEATRALAEEDLAGRRWCREIGYGGYTSYASLADLPTRATCFADLKRRLDREAAGFAELLAFDLGGRRLRLDSLWVNVLQPRAGHSGHIHPTSVISGTVYLETPPGSGGLRLEDPRLPLMMAAPPPRADAPLEARRFHTLQPQAGDVVLWESWLRHEVTPNRGRRPRLSVSFNYA